MNAKREAERASFRKLLLDLYEAFKESGWLSDKPPELLNIKDSPFLSINPPESEAANGQSDQA